MESQTGLSALDTLKEYYPLTDLSKLIYVDVGAGEPEYYSNSLVFRGMGAKVISIEPNPRFCKMFREKGYDVLEYAATREGREEELLFREHDLINGLSTSCIADFPSTRNDYPYVEYKVKASTLNLLLEKYYPEVNHIDILDIDTEGNEIDVLKGLNIEKYQPKVIIVENIDPKNNGYYAYYEQIGYSVVNGYSHNDILIKK